MFQQDYLIRQVQQLAQVLAQVLFHKQVQRYEQAQAVLAEGIERALGAELGALYAMPRERFANQVAEAGLSGDAVISLAHALEQDADPRGRERALWLYEAALASGDVVPLNVYERMDLLRVSLR
jgi:hypothetical protein